MLPCMAVEVVPSFAVQDAWNKLPTVDPGAVLTPYEGVEVEGVPENTSSGSHDVGGRSIDVENKVNGSGEQHFSTQEQPLTPPCLPSPEATPTPAQNTWARRTTPGAFPDDDSTINTSPTGPQVPIQARVNTLPSPTVPALPDPSSPSWALQESL
jgi:hypothetical protein